MDVGLNNIMIILAVLDLTNKWEKGRERQGLQSSKGVHSRGRERVQDGLVQEA